MAKARRRSKNGTKLPDAVDLTQHPDIFVHRFEHAARTCRCGATSVDAPRMLHMQGRSPKPEQDKPDKS